MTKDINSAYMSILTIVNMINIKDTVDILLKVITSVSIIKGISYLKTLKEKTNAASFSFWSQLRVRMFELSHWLSNEYDLLDNLFEPDSRRTWESTLSSNNERKIEFKKKVEELISFVKVASDQMPAYVGWTKDYSELLVFLNDVIQYDICNNKEGFKFKGDVTLQQRNEYCKNICNIINRMCGGIEREQKKIEKKILG